MDVMELRRRIIEAMASGETLPAGWKKTTLTASTTIVHGDELANLLTSQIPQCKVAFGYRDSTQTPIYNEVVAFMWGGNSGSSAYQRFRTTFYQAMTTWTSGYDTKISQGATYTVVYVE